MPLLWLCTPFLFYLFAKTRLHFEFFLWKFCEQLNHYFHWYNFPIIYLMIFLNGWLISTLHNNLIQKRDYYYLIIYYTLIIDYINFMYWNLDLLHFLSTGFFPLERKKIMFIVYTFLPLEIKDKHSCKLHFISTEL